MLNRQGSMDLIWVFLENKSRRAIEAKISQRIHGYSGESLTHEPGLVVEYC